MIPTCRIRIMVGPTSPPRPMGADIYADDVLIGVVTLDELLRAADEARTLLDARKGADCGKTG